MASNNGSPNEGTVRTSTNTAIGAAASSVSLGGIRERVSVVNPTLDL